MNWIKKLIPSYIEIRSMYWIEIEREMNSDLVSIFNKIDEDNLQDAKNLIENFIRKWDGKKYPEWIKGTYAQICRAQSMVYFLNH